MDSALIKINWHSSFPAQREKFGIVKVVAVNPDDNLIGTVVVMDFVAHILKEGKVAALKVLQHEIKIEHFHHLLPFFILPAEGIFLGKCSSQ
jgi:pyruvate/2-oxoglutarate dehydrogenase complex dihydrolipoamide dehydrogenase (E3) component